MRYEISKYPVGNHPVDVYEFDKNGALVGHYDGFFDWNRNIFRLYPKYNPFIRNHSYMQKKIISASAVKYVGGNR